MKLHRVTKPPREHSCRIGIVVAFLVGACIGAIVTLGSIAIP